MDCGIFAIYLAFEDLKLHGKIYDVRAPLEGVPDVINGDTQHNRRDKKKEATTGGGLMRCYSREEKEVDDNDLRQMVDATFLNHIVFTPSGKGISAILLPFGWDGDFRAGQDLQRIVMLNKVPKVMNDAKKLLGKHGVDDSNVHVDALVTRTKEIN
jgi:hypothetical protein